MPKAGPPMAITSMRFTIEQRHLTDDGGKPLPQGSVSFHSCEAATVDEAVRLFVKKNDAEVLGSVMTFPGFQAVATVRNPAGVFTLQIAPSSQQFRA
jgi:hypothetical protein